MKKFAAILFAALTLTVASASGAQAVGSSPSVDSSSATSLGPWPPACMRVPPYPVKCDPTNV